jgi:hypothetical protein
VEWRRAAFWTFVAAEAVIFAGLIWNFHGRWFIADEWDFLAQRTAGSFNSLFTPYKLHWSTLPILYFRLLWNLVGIRTYYPYLVSVLAFHIGIASLLRVVMIRARVLPWIATVAALLFSLYGAGYSDISYAFNIGFDGSVFFGLLFLIAVDHPGPTGRRDALGILAGLASLMCSGIGVAMIVTVVMAAWMRHGWRRALSVGAPPAIIYLIWFVSIGHGAHTSYASASSVIAFVVLGLAFSFSSLGHSPVAGVVLAGMLLIGWVVAVRSSVASDLRSRFSAPVALLAGAVVFLIITGIERADPSLPSSDTYAASRYLYVVVAMLIPALAVAATQLVTAWRGLWPLILVVLLLGVPGNVLVMHRNSGLHGLDAYRQFILTIPTLPIATHLPPSTYPDPLFDRSITVGWLLEGVRDGKIPPPSPPATAGERAYWTLLLAWHAAAPTPSGQCYPVALPAMVGVQVGTRLTTDAPVDIAAVFGSHQLSRSVRWSSSTHRSSWPMEVQVTPTTGHQSITVCGTNPEFQPVESDHGTG